MLEEGKEKRWATMAMPVAHLELIDELQRARDESRRAHRTKACCEVRE